jgi:hypothetical protein
VRVFIVLVLSARLWAQSVSFGLRTGLVVSPIITAEAGRRFTLGPCLETRLWRGAAIDVDVLLQRPAFEVTPAHSRVTIWQVEAPVTLIYRFRGRPKPFLRTGVAFNRVFAVEGAAPCARGPFGEQFYCVDGSPVAELRHRSTPGLVIGGGIGWKLGKLRVDPEFRVTHWIDRNFGVRDSAIRSNLNEATLLFGVIF